MSDNKENTSQKKKKGIDFNPKGKPGQGKKPFNFYWIYGIIGAILIAINLFSFSGLQKTELREFSEMVKSHDVQKIVVVNNETVEITIKKDRLADPKYKDVQKKTFGGESGAHFYLEIGSDEQFVNYLNEFQIDYSPEERIRVNNEKRKNWGGEIFGWLLPIIIMVGIWLFIMRRMTGGGGGGSQIFNIGKSKATLFDKETMVSTTFEDVAGLEEAKIEIQEIVEFLKNPKTYTDIGAKIPK